jgi:hypothetical protein
MLPAPKRDRISLADVLQSSLAAVDDSLGSVSNRLGLSGVNKAIVVLVDGLGAAALKARSGHARTLAAAFTASSVIDSGFPTTTASALASLTTGVLPGQHGMVGYSVLDAANDRVVNQLSGWDDRLDPLTWQLVPTLFETAIGAGRDAVVIGPARYADSGFTHAVLRGARYLPAQSIADRLERAADWLREPGTGIAYVYVPELDSAGHAFGWESPEWTTKLELLDGAVKDLIGALGKKDGLLVTADHGVVDVPRHAQVLFGDDPELTDGIRHVAGEPRCLQLHFEPDADHDRIIRAWRAAEDGRSWVATKDEAIAANWFGDVRDEFLPRIGDLIVAARKGIAYYDSRSASEQSMKMVGQHGSFSPDEVRVPLIRFGAFAR